MIWCRRFSLGCGCKEWRYERENIMDIEESNVQWITRIIPHQSLMSHYVKRSILPDSVSRTTNQSIKLWKYRIQLNQYWHISLKKYLHRYESWLTLSNYPDDWNVGESHRRQNYYDSKTILTTEWRMGNKLMTARSNYYYYTYIIDSDMLSMPHSLGADWPGSA